MNGLLTLRQNQKRRGVKIKFCDFDGLLDKNKRVESVLQRTLRAAVGGVSSGIAMSTFSERLILRYLAVIRSRTGLHRRWHRFAAIEMELEVLEKICMWIPTNDPLFDGLLKILKLCGTKDEIGKIAREMMEVRKSEISATQRRKAQEPRPTPLGRILDELVRDNPSISEREALKAIRGMVGNGVVSGVTEGNIEVDIAGTKITETVKRSQLRSRLGHAKERFRKNSSR